MKGPELWSPACARTIRRRCWQECRLARARWCVYVRRSPARCTAAIGRERVVERLATRDSLIPGGDSGLNADGVAQFLRANASGRGLEVEHRQDRRAP
jgi:hypothetical protein